MPHELDEVGSRAGVPRARLAALLALERAFAGTCAANSPW